MASLEDYIDISDFGLGLVTDFEPLQTPKNAAIDLKGLDTSHGALEKLPGTDDFAARLGWALPVGDLAQAAIQVRLENIVAPKDVILVHAKNGATHKILMRPYLRLGVWREDKWENLTEIEGPYTADALTSSAQIVDSELLVGDSASFFYFDYYTSWIVYNSTRNVASIVSAFNATTKALTMEWAVTGQTAGDTFWLMRNPVYDLNRNALFKPERVFFHVLENNRINILTGGDDGYNDAGKSDLSLTYINQRKYFDDTGLTFSGYHLTRKNLDFFDSPTAAALSLAVTSGTDIALPATPSTGAASLVVSIIAVYDGTQDAPQEPGVSPYDGTVFSNNQQIAWSGGQKLQIDLTVYAGSTFSSGVPILTPNRGTFDYVMFDRRITALKVYVAEGHVGSGDTKLVTPFRLADTVFIDNTGWSGTGQSYTYQLFITGDKWNPAAGGDTLVTDQGHPSIKVHANASHAVAARDRVFYLDAYTDKQRRDFVFYSAISGAGVAMPDVVPHTNFIPLDLYGINCGQALLEAFGYVIVVGLEAIMRIDASSRIPETKQVDVGAVSNNGVIKIDRLIYFADMDDIYAYHAASNIARSIVTGRIREYWRGLSNTDKETCAVGYDKRKKFLVIAAGTATLFYRLPKSIASELAADADPSGSWHFYPTAYTFVRFFTGRQGQCIGVTQAGALYELFAATPTGSIALEYESPEFQGYYFLDGLGLTYNSDQVVTVEIYDTNRSATDPRKTFRFPAKSRHARKIINKSHQFKGNMKLRLTTPSHSGAATKITRIEVNPKYEDR